MSKIAGIYWDDTAAAPGIALSVYFSGCHFHCPGCHNPEAQDFNYGRDYDTDISARNNEKAKEEWSYENSMYPRRRTIMR